MTPLATDGQHGKLFHVQDGDRPLYVMAGSWSHAIASWKRVIAHENDMDVEDVEEPQGVQLVATEDEWIHPLWDPEDVIDD